MTKSSSRRRTPENARVTRPPWLALAAVGAVLSLGAVIIAVVSGGQQATLPTPQVVGAPRVQVTPEMIDHGDVRYGTPVESIFLVRNVGDQPLTILGEPRVELIEGC